MCLTVQTEVTVATVCPLAKQLGATPSPPEPWLPLLGTELNTDGASRRMWPLPRTGPQTGASPCPSRVGRGAPTRTKEPLAGATADLGLPPVTSVSRCCVLTRAPKIRTLSPNSQNLRRCPHLETPSLKKWFSYNEISREGPNPIGLLSSQEEIERDPHREGPREVGEKVPSAS